MSRKPNPDLQMTVSLLAVLILAIASVAAGYWMGRYTPPGDARFVMLVAFVILALYGLVAWIAIEKPVRAWKAADRELTRIITTDPLTTLQNRTAILDRLGREWNRSVRTAEPLSAIAIEVDGLEGIQERFGQPTRNTVMRCVGALIGTSCRQYDSAGRLGPNGFLMILPSTGLDGAARAAERLRDRVVHSEFACDGQGYTVTVSAGVTQADVNARESVEDVLKRLDGALKDAQAEGGNTVRATAPIAILAQ